jgi:hypothetical protein
MKTQIKLLLFLLFITASRTMQAQTIDSFYVDRSVSPHALFVRIHFPDSSYYVTRTFDRVALIYPPANMVTFFYRSCDFVKANPVRDTTIAIYTPEPYSLWLFLATDTNTATPGCALTTEVLTIDTASYRTEPAEPTGFSDTRYSGNSLRVFPNPAAGILNVAGAQDCELQLSDGLGRLWLQQKLGNSQETVDVSMLVPGLYYIHCYRDGQRLKSLCFSKLP